MNEVLEQSLVSLLRQKKLVITTAESCTGGMVGAAIVNVPGASAVFQEGYITYSDEAKKKMLGVRQETLQRFTAVSAETAAEMAQGGARQANADVCIAVTGVAGPDPEDGRPVGLVYIGCCYRGRVSVEECHFEGTRQDIRKQACRRALMTALNAVRKNKIDSNP